MSFDQTPPAPPSTSSTKKYDLEERTASFGELRGLTNVPTGKPVLVFVYTDP